jgi:hypothetical protein
MLQVSFDALVLKNLTLQQVSVLNVSDGTYNITNSDVVGAQTHLTSCLLPATRDDRSPLHVDSWISMVTMTVCL